jgi:V8-like Glu-specific endopeptidase
MKTQTDVPKPLLVKEWGKSIKQIKIKQRKKSSSLIQLNELDLPKNLLAKAELKKDLKKNTVGIYVNTDEIGKHYFPPSIKTVKLSDRQYKGKALAEANTGFIPDHLELKQFPKELEKKLHIRQRFISQLKQSRKDMGLPTNVFSPDDRFTFSDTAFPWSTCGRVDTAGGWGSGVMIGPRHMMTASHVINWGPNNTAGWVKFTPLAFDNSTPFGIAWVTRIYWWQQVNGGDGISSSECPFDYVVCVLDREMGNSTGWMGSRGYNTAWDGGDYWGHIGYPSDLAGGKRPAFVGYQKFDSTFTGTTSGRTSYGIKHKIDVIPGQSGGPYFGWWDSEPWPRVVSIQSAHQWGGATGPNTCGGGNPLSELINHARTVEP